MLSAELMDILREVTDPEIPRVSIVDLGMVEGASVKGEHITVSLIPTFVGCPAQMLIQEKVQEHLLAAFPTHAISVRLSLEVPWSTDRITDTGRQALKQSGIAPPGADLNDVACPFCNRDDTLLQNLFASTSCRSLYYCRACQNPFEAFKPL